MHFGTNRIHQDLRRLIAVLTIGIVATIVSILSVSATALAAKAIEVWPAAVTSIGLKANGLDPKSTVNDISIKGVQAKVSNGVLNVLVLKDPGSDKRFVISLRDRNGLVVKVSAVVVSTLPTAIDAWSDEKIPPLRISGLGEQNALTGSALVFGVPGVGELSKPLSRLTFNFYNGTTIDLSSQWTYDVATNKLVLSAGAINLIWNSIPTGAFDVIVDIATSDASFAGNYHFKAVKPQAVINGTLVDGLGAAVTTLGGKYVGLVGARTGVRRTAKLNADGTFVFPNVVSDSYKLDLLDLKFPGLTSSSVAVFTFDTTVTAKLVYVAPPAAKLLLNDGETTMKLGIGGSFSGNGKGPVQRRKQQMLPAPKLPSTCNATSSTMGVTQTCQLNFTVPKGTQFVSMKIAVTTAEYPYYTGSQSQFDDTWSYVVSGIPGQVVQASGNVNLTHRNIGTITKDGCFDVKQAASASAFQVTAIGRATNIGDGAYPTTVSITLDSSCNELLVTKATLSSPNAKGYGVMYTHPEHGGLISIPTNTAYSNWGIPLSVQYAPPTAKITGATLRVIVAGTAVATADIDVPADAGNGIVNFKDLIVPKLPQAWSRNAISLNVQLKGKLNAVDVTSQATSPNIDRNGRLTFLPLWLGNDDPALALNRYGIRDAGGDSWANKDMIDWLKGRTFNTKSYRFDDITALHAARDGKRSVLDHATHFEGLSGDLRYADGAGGFTDTLGGQSVGGEPGYYIHKLINDAYDELVSGATKTPKQTKLRKWIAENRALMTQLDTDQNVSLVYIGPTWMTQALVLGKYPTGDDIQGVAAWTKPGKVAISTADHHSHWHVLLFEKAYVP